MALVNQSVALRPVLFVLFYPSLLADVEPVGAWLFITVTSGGLSAKSGGLWYDGG